MGETSGRIAVVTGGASNLGRAIAMALASKGAAVAVADIKEAGAVAVADEIKQAGGLAVGFGCDVSERGSVKALQVEVERRLGPTSLLITNAGAKLFRPLTKMSDGEIDGLVQVNLLGVINCLQAFLPDMLAMREGHVVATASSSVLAAPGMSDHAVYVATKAGVVGLMLGLRRELQKFGIGATVLCPEGVSTQIFELSRNPEANLSGRSRPPEEVAEMVLHAIRNDKAMVVTRSDLETIYDLLNIVSGLPEQQEEWHRVASSRALKLGFRSAHLPRRSET